MNHKPLLLSLLALSVLGGCAVTDPRATDRAPGAVPPVAEPARYTDEAQRADHRVLQSAQDRLAILNKDGRVAQNSYAWAKSQCWLDMARQNYHENDRSGVIGEALQESVNLIDVLEQGKTPAVSTPLIGSRVRAARRPLGPRRARPHRPWRCLRGGSGRLPGSAAGLDGPRIRRGRLAPRQPLHRHGRKMASRMEADQAACAGPVAAAPAAAPVVIEREVERLVIATDALFEFDRSGLNDIRAAGRARLDMMAKRAQGLQDIERIALVGHTDRLGSDAYNQPLSLQRATAVRDYLVSQGLAASLFTVEGRGVPSRSRPAPTTWPAAR